MYIHEKATPWPESMSELYRLSNYHMPMKLVPTSVDRECHVSLLDTYGHIIRFLDWSFFFFFQVAPHLYSQG
jgi:hypothetical protein